MRPGECFSCQLPQVPIKQFWQQQMLTLRWHRLNGQLAATVFLHEQHQKREK